MRIDLPVFVVLPDGRVEQAGELAARLRDNGTIAGQFRYADAWLESPRAFPLDPINLPLKPGPQDAGRPQAGVHGVFEDALPDDWGMKLLIRHHQLNGHRLRPPWLLAVLGNRVGNRGVGALRFGEQGGAERDAGVLARLDPSEYRRASHLVARFELGRFSGTSFEERLVQAGSSAGGARPKILLPPSEASPEGLILKFASRSDRVDMVRMEAACMLAARDCGLQPARTRLPETAHCLEVIRFDVTPSGGRRHMVSLKTLLGAENFYYSSYGAIADRLARLSANPREDQQRLFRQMLFNAFIGNRDDHLKNFLMLRDEEGWRLSPAFDLVPQFPLAEGPHVLRFLYAEYRPDRNECIQIGRQFGFSPSVATSLLEQVVEGMARLGDHLASCRVPDEETEALLSHVAAYRERLAGRGMSPDPGMSPGV